jgi:putative membrane protein
VVHRPYVWAFFACFLVFALRELGARRTALFTLLAYGVAFASEYSSTRNGIPFGHYVYLDATRTRELWISNVPFWDSLSFVFLAYFSGRVASALRDPARPLARRFDPGTAVLGGFLMMLLDVVIDPVALRGDQWFLGRIYFYPSDGPYFGVTLANFAGWFAVGTLTLLLFQGLCRTRWLGRARERRLLPRETLGCFGVYAAVLLFNLAVTAGIGAWRLFAASAAVTAATLGACGLALLRHRLPGRLPRQAVEGGSR